MDDRWGLRRSEDGRWAVLTVVGLLALAAVTLPVELYRSRIGHEAYLSCLSFSTATGDRLTGYARERAARMAEAVRRDASDLDGIECGAGADGDLWPAVHFRPGTSVTEVLDTFEVRPRRFYRDLCRRADLTRPGSEGSCLVEADGLLAAAHVWHAPDGSLRITLRPLDHV